MTIERNMKGTTLQLKLSGWLDTQSAPMFEEVINGIGEMVSTLTIDCSALEYISSAGLRQIVAAYKKMTGNLSLRNVSDEIMHVIRMTGLDRRLKFEG